MVREMVTVEEKLSQSQGSNSSQGALSTNQEFSSSQESQQLPGEAKTAQTEENSAVQLASSDLASLPSLLPVLTEETAQVQSGPLSPELPPATPFKAPGPQRFKCFKCEVICKNIQSYRYHLLTHYYRYSSHCKLYKYYHDI